MSIKHSILAMLLEGPRYGYQLRSEFEDRTGGTWPLNIGQVYTTLDRLDRDGFIENKGDDGEGHVIYQLTEKGEAEAQQWFESPVERNSLPRNELAIKIALALTVPGVDVSAVIQVQRSASIRSLQEFNRLRRSADSQLDTAWLLVLDSHIFAAEAEVRWLDHAEVTAKKALRPQRSSARSDQASTMRSHS